jgi:exosortase A
MKDFFIASRWALPFLLLSTLIAISWEATYSMVMLWLTTDTYMHGIFVLPLAAIMAKQKAFPPGRPDPVSSFTFVTLSLLWASGMLFGHLAMLNVIQQSMLLAIIPLIVITCYGWKIAWHYRAPLCLVFFAVPIGDFMIPHLQSVTADMSVWLLQMSGVAVVRNGWYISIPAADFRVAEACSGINFLISTFTVAVFYAFTYMEKLNKRIAFILMGLIVPIAANGLRVYLIIMIAHWGNVEAATGFDHLVYGWIFFVAILVALFTIGHFWQDPPVENTENGVMFDASPMRLNKKTMLLFISPVIIVATLAWVSLSKSEQVTRVPLATTVHSKTDVLGLTFPAADHVSSEKVTSDIIKYQVYYANESVDKKIIGYQNRWFNGKVWSVARIGSYPVDDLRFVKLDLIDLSGREGTLYYGFCVGGQWESTSLKVKLRQFVSRLLGVDHGATAYAWFGIADHVIENELNTEKLKSLCL